MSITRILLEPAWVLHARPWRDTSLLVELFTREHGRVAGIARGARSRRGGMVLVPFAPLLVSRSVRGQPGLITAVEALPGAVPLAGTALSCGFYLNELVYRMLAREDPHPGLFDTYGHTLDILRERGPDECALRLFEKRLLAEIGFALVLDREAERAYPIDPEHLYRYDCLEGPRRAGGGVSRPGLVHGATLIALDRGELADARSRRESKHLMREVIDHHLGGRALMSREMLRTR